MKQEISEVRISVFCLLDLSSYDELEKYGAESHECFKKLMEFCYGTKKAE